MRPTRVAVLAALVVVAAAVTWAVLRVLDSRMSLQPGVPSSAAVALLLLAVALAVTARSLQARLQRRPGTKPVHPLIAARMAALAKAGSHTGALATGVYTGVALFLLPASTAFVRGNAARAGLAVLAALLVMAAALFLERVCRVPDAPPSDDDAVPS
jgi:hypothetical protein